VGVKDSSAEFLQYLDKNEISLGQELEVLDKEAFDGSMLISIDNKELRVSQVVSNNLYVKTL
jgi:DtxR family Mn-dependent transcriptional regulator